MLLSRGGSANQETHVHGKPRPDPDLATVQARLAYLRHWDAHLHAFVALCDPDAAPQRAGPLADVSIGVKDNIDVAGLPTRNGSAACSDAPPALHDAPVVAALRGAGGQILGKTTSTEFAFTDPTDCRNPYDLARSPGGSSSGSGSAVGAGIADVALGTQTAGSLCRPAAYCGAVGFKPSYGAIPTTGVTPLSPSFDTVGIIARSVALARRSFEAIGPRTTLPRTDDASNLVLHKALLATSLAPSSRMQTALDEAARALLHPGSAAMTGTLMADVPTIVAHHRTIMNFEAAEAHEALISQDSLDQLQPRFRAALLAGAKTTSDEVAQARYVLSEATRTFWESLAEVDLVLCLPVPDAAPHIGGTTGYQDWLTPWTVFGGPLICLPWGLDDTGRPLSVMLAAHPGCDADLLAVAARLEAHAPPLPPPLLPI